MKKMVNFKERELIKWQVVEMLRRGVKRIELQNEKGQFDEESCLKFAVCSGGCEMAAVGDVVSKISEQYQKAGVEVVAYWEESFPKLLKEIPDPPVLLFCKGDWKLLNKLQITNNKLQIGALVAVVGSREMSNRGRRAVRKIVPKLTEEGFGVVSGLAIGTDSFVHETCLFVGGRTVAVLPSPLDMIYPRRNQGLAKKIIEAGGCLVSEYPRGVAVERKNFLERNRVVAGLCERVIVTEASKYSGSISTPNFALDQGRDVWCYPARKGEVNSEGILALIEDGAGEIRI